MKKYDAILFDLDGTVLPMDIDYFVKSYFKVLAVKLAKHGYDPEAAIQALQIGTHAMIKNDGSKTNEQAFWDKFFELIPPRDDTKTIFESFYKNEFETVAELFPPNPLIPDVLQISRRFADRIILATNPLFPYFATESRIRWAGLEVSDFELYTSYEDCHYCKPNVKYYTELFERTGLDAKRCLMVGNDAKEDTVVSELGTDVYLITDYLLNRENTDISGIPHGDFPAFAEWLQSR